MIRARIFYSNQTVDFFQFNTRLEAKAFAYEQAIKQRVGVLGIQYEEVKQCTKLNTIAC